MGILVNDEFISDMYLNIVNDDTPLNENEYMVEFKGLIATSRVHYGSKYNYTKKQGLTFITIGYSNGKYLDITINLC